MRAAGIRSDLKSKTPKHECRHQTLADAGLIVALAGNVLLSAVLIVKLSRFDDSKRQADEADARTAKQRTELAKLQTEVESLTKRKDALAATVADWEKRLKEMQTPKRLADS